MISKCKSLYSQYHINTQGCHWSLKNKINLHFDKYGNTFYGRRMALNISWRSWRWNEFKGSLSESNENLNHQKNGNRRRFNECACAVMQSCNTVTGFWGIPLNCFNDDRKSKKQFWFSLLWRLFLSNYVWYYNVWLERPLVFWRNMIIDFNSYECKYFIELIRWNTQSFYFIVPFCLLANTIENRGDLSVRGARPLAEVRTSDKLHYIIDSPKGVVQIGNCCVLLQVDFSSSLVNRLLEEGDINCKLHIFRHFFTNCSSAPYVSIFLVHKVEIN